MLSSALHTTPSEYYTQTQREEIKFLKKKKKKDSPNRGVCGSKTQSNQGIIQTDKQTKILRRLKVAVLRLEMLV